MKTNNLPDYPRITLSDLSRLELDTQSARRFERRFYSGLLGGAGLAFAGVAGTTALHHFNAISDGVFATAFIACFVLGLILCLCTHHRMMRALPRSSQGGHEMAPFIIQDLEAPDHYELAYVDQTSGTYFRRLYVERGG